MHQQHGYRTDRGGSRATLVRHHWYRPVAVALTLTLGVAACQRGEEASGARAADQGGVPAGPVAAVESLASTAARTAVAVTVYKSPSCGCCAAWVDHMKEAGFAVTTVDQEDVTPIKAQYGVADSLASCHTAIVDAGDGARYVVEGHVPAADVRRLLRERPQVVGLAAPGMPVGSPGMEMPGTTPDRYDVVSFGRDGATRVFASH